MSNPLRRQERAAAEGATAADRACTSAQILTDEELSRYGDGEAWVTLVEDASQVPGDPQLDEHRLLCHPDDLVEMEQLAIANGLRVRVEGKLLEQIGWDQPYDVAMGYRQPRSW